MNILKLGLATCVIATLTGCASIAGDNTRQVKVSSYPQGAAIMVDNQQYGTTPATITLPSYIYGGKNVLLKKKGYQDTSMMVNTSFQPVALLDILFWPTFIVDGMTGDLVKIDPANRNLSTNLQHA
jgi:hypothetical protein